MRDRPARPQGRRRCAPIRRGARPGPRARCAHGPTHLPVRPGTAPAAPRPHAARRPHGAAHAGPPLIGATGAPPAMQAAFAPMLAERALAGSKVSVLVVPAGGGEPVFGYHADERVHPASNTKLLTTAAALSRLGPAYTFATDLAAPSITGGVVPTLYLIGRGDPDVPDRVALETAGRGAPERPDRGRRGSGDRRELLHGRSHAAGFRRPDDGRGVPRALGAASLNFNQLVVSIWPGAKAGDPVTVRVSPDSGYATVENKARTRAKGKPRLNVLVEPDGDRVIAAHLGQPDPGRRALRDAAPHRRTRRSFWAWRPASCSPT